MTETLQPRLTLHAWLMDMSNPVAPSASRHNTMSGAGAAASVARQIFGVR
jgi:hypothetical protein